MENNYYKPLPIKIKKLLLIVKAGLTSASGAALVTGSPYWAAGIAIATGIVHEACEVLFSE